MRIRKIIKEAKSPEFAVLLPGYLSGFAEKFVPDILVRMAKNDKGVAK